MTIHRPIVGKKCADETFAFLSNVYEKNNT